MGRKLRADQHGVFPGYPTEERYSEKNRVLGRWLARRAGLPTPEKQPFENLGNPDLPAWGKKAEIQQMIRDHQISMVSGDTGSGKTSQLFQYALEMGYKKILYFEPRVLLADNVSDRGEYELSRQLGLGKARDMIGVRHSEKSTGKGRQVEIMTAATFLRVKEELRKYKDEPLLVVADEIHEKDFETESAVAVFVQELQYNPKWRLVLASATLDADPISQAYSSMNGSSVPRTHIEGRPHSLESFEEPELDPVEVYEKYGLEHEKAMIFTAGKAEIRDIMAELQKRKLGRVRITPLHAKLPYEDIRKATNAKLDEGERQIIVSTSAGQSGLTIPGLTLVISDGTTRRPDLDADGTPGLFKELCVQDELTQQAGRAGRDVAGGQFVLAKPSDDVFSFVSKEERKQQAPAQIYHTNISRNVLLASSFDTNFYELNKFLIHKVDQLTILEAYDVLFRLTALDELNSITQRGVGMNRYPLRPELSRALVAAQEDGASDRLLRHLAAIVSSIEAGGLPYFEKGVGSEWKEDIREETSDDYIAQLDMFYATRDLFDHSRVDEKALQLRNYDPKNTYRAHKTFDKLLRSMGISELGIDTIPPTLDEEEFLREYLTAGLFDFVHKKSAQDGRVTEFVSIHERYEPVRRRLSDRGTYQGSDDLVIGMPRRFEKKQDSELVEHSVIENALPTSVQKLSKHVFHLLERRPVVDSRVVGGRLKRVDELRFGELSVGQVDSVSRLIHTPETRSQLREAAYRKPTNALEELVTIKKEIEYLARIAPADRLNEFFPNGTLTQEWLDTIIDQQIDGEVDSIYVLDNKLRTRIVFDAISINNWISREHRDEIRRISPEYFSMADGTEYRLSYSHGKPVINHFNLQHADFLPDEGLFLDDGREVLINYRIGQDTKKHSARAIKEYVRAIDQV